MSCSLVPLACFYMYTHLAIGRGSGPLMQDTSPLPIISSQDLVPLVADNSEEPAKCQLAQFIRSTCHRVIFLPVRISSPYS